MTIQAKIEAAQTAIRTISSIIPFAMEHQDFIHSTKNLLFAKIVASENLSDQQKEEEIDIATMGIFVMAITAHQALYKGESYLWYPDHCSYYKSAYYPKSYGEVLKLSGVNDTLALEQFKTEPNTQNELMVLAVGTKVMNGELPFNSETFKEILDKHTPHALSDFAGPPDYRATFESNLVALKICMDETAIKINQNPQHYYTSFVLNETVNTGYHAIEKTFHDALNLASASHETPDKKKFMDGLNALKRETLANFTAKKANFDFDNSVTLANSALSLATKVGSNTVTQSDVNQFTQATQKYKTSHAFAIALAVIIGAVIGMIAGAAIGFAVGSIPGAIIGGVAGLVVGGGIAGVSSTMWYTKKEPLNKISSAATEMVPNQPAAGV